MLPADMANPNSLMRKLGLTPATSDGARRLPSEAREGHSANSLIFMALQKWHSDATKTFAELNEKVCTQMQANCTGLDGEPRSLEFFERPREQAGQRVFAWTGKK